MHNIIALLLFCRIEFGILYPLYIKIRLLIIICQVLCCVDWNGHHVVNAATQIWNSLSDKTRNSSALEFFTKENAKISKHRQSNAYKIVISAGYLILILKPHTPTGPMDILRPLVLLTIFRKIISTITLNRICPCSQNLYIRQVSGPPAA